MLEPRAVISQLRNGLGGRHISHGARPGDNDDVFFAINVRHDARGMDTAAEGLATDARRKHQLHGRKFDRQGRDYSDRRIGCSRTSQSARGPLSLIDHQDTPSPRCSIIVLSASWSIPTAAVRSVGRADSRLSSTALRTAELSW